MKKNDCFQTFCNNFKFYNDVNLARYENAVVTVRYFFVRRVSEKNKQNPLSNFRANLLTCKHQTWSTVVLQILEADLSVPTTGSWR